MCPLKKYNAITFPGAKYALNKSRGEMLRFSFRILAENIALTLRI